MISDGVRIDAEGNITIKSEMLRDFDSELGHLERRVDDNLKELGYPHCLKTLENVQTTEWRHLFGLKQTIHLIRKHRDQGDDVSPLIFDLGIQVGRARTAVRVSDARSASGKLSGRKRREDIAILKREARRAFDACLKRTKKKEQSYLAAKNKVGTKYGVHRSIRTIKRWLKGE